MTRPFVESPPVAGGVDLDLPGDEVRLRATRWRGAGTPVLLLHGLASSRHFWDLVVPDLAGLPVIALDQRGHGDSARPEAPYDAATVARDALTALDALGLSRVVVVGHSWGAGTALRLAATAPERVLAVVAVDGGISAPRDGLTREQVRLQLTPPQHALEPAQVRDLLRLGPLGPWWSPAVEAAMLPLFGLGDDGLVRARLPFEAHMAIVDSLLDDNPADLLPAVRCPAWLVSCEPIGGDDWSRRKAAGLDAAAATLAQPRLLRWAGALHDVPLQWPTLVSGLIRAAVREVAT